MNDRPKLQTVAEEAGVSTATVSQVMRGAGRISDATRKKVLAAAGRVNYVPDARAAAMRSGDNREIGLLIHKIANPFNSEVISGVSDLLEAEGYFVSVLDSRDDSMRQHANIEALIRSRRGGLLWVPALNTTDSTYQMLAAQRIPTVTFLRRSAAGNLDHVGIENIRASRQATDHLADLGHRHIAYVGGHKPVDARLERIDGYRQVLKERNLGSEVIIACPDDKLAGLEAMERICAKHPHVTGIVCNGDMVALGALAAMLRRGLVPGEDLSIVGFDDVQDASLSIPPLTTMAVAPYDLGRRLARVMLDRIREPDMPAVNVSVPAKLIVRATTGAPRPSD